MIQSLDHIQLAMPAGQEAKARQFYGTLLGLTEVTKPEPLASRGGCWFAGPGIEIHLGVDPEFRPAKKAHPGFRVVDLRQWQQHLQAAGVTITPATSLPHVRRFYANDPFGNRLAFIQSGDRLT